MTDSIKSQEGLTRREMVFSGAAGIAGLAIGGGIVGAITSSGGSEDTGTTKNTSPITIGGAFPLTGVSAGDGVEAKRALEMAANDLNEAGGVLGRKVETVALDIESDLVPDKIRNVLQRLVNENNVADGVDGLLRLRQQRVGPGRHQGRAALPRQRLHRQHGLGRRGSRDARHDLRDRAPTRRTTVPTSSGLLARLQDSGKWTPKKKTVAIATSTDPYSLLIAENFRDGIQKEGWEVVVYEKVTAPLSEWGPVLSKIRAAVPDLVVNTDWLATDLAAFTKQFMGSPTPSLVYEQFGPSTPEYLELAGDAANGVIWSTTVGVLPDKMGDDFRARFDETYGVKMGFSTAGAIYDQVMIWAQAAGMAGDAEDYPSVVNWIKSGIHRGIVGTAHFNPDGQPGALVPVRRQRPQSRHAAALLPDPERPADLHRPVPLPHRRVRVAAAAQVRACSDGDPRDRGADQAVRRARGRRRGHCVVEQGEVFGIAGPNGAGKTTLFDVISGHGRATEGVVRFKGQEIQHLPAYSICHLGMARTYQVASVLTTQTVLGNIVLASYFGHKKRSWAGLSYDAGDRRARGAGRRVRRPAGRARRPRRAALGVSTASASCSPRLWRPGPTSCSSTSRPAASATTSACTSST